MTAGTMAVETKRHLLQGTGGGEVLDTATLVAFTWRPDPGEAWDFWNEAGHATWSRESSTTGLVVFEGVTPELPIGTRTAAVRFALSAGHVFDRDIDGGAASWSWMPATGVLDPGKGGVFALPDRQAGACGGAL